MLKSPAECAEAPARDDLGLPLAQAPSLLISGFAHARAGRVTQSLADLERVRSSTGSDLTALQWAALFTTLVECRLARGELGAARALGADLVGHLGEPGLTGAVAHYGRGLLADAGGEPDLAAGHFRCAGRLTAGAEDDPGRLPWRTAAALAEVRVGRRRSAVALAREHLELARAGGAPYAVALGLRTLATVDAHTDRVALLREARAALGSLPAARLAAQIDTDLAGMLLLSGGAPEEALVLLRRTEQYAGSEQLWPLRARARRLLDLLGEAPLPASEEDRPALTAAETRVARLAADGLSNREVAGRLGVTVKAVEWHLSRIYRKLGISSRAGLAGCLSAGS